MATGSGVGVVHRRYLISDILLNVAIGTVSNRADSRCPESPRSPAVTRTRARRRLRPVTVTKNEIDHLNFEFAEVRGDRIREDNVHEGEAATLTNQDIRFKHGVT